MKPLAPHERRPDFSQALHLGRGDLSCNQPEKGKVQTPAIDALSADGMRFTNAHAPHSVCTPTRYSALSGRYCWRTFLREGLLPGYAKTLIPPTRTTIASALKGQGYAMAAFGKWHPGLGRKPVDGDPGDFHFGSHLHGPEATAAALPEWVSEDGVDQRAQFSDTGGNVRSRLDDHTVVRRWPLDLAGALGALEANFRHTSLRRFLQILSRGRADGDAPHGALTSAEAASFTITKPIPVSRQISTNKSRRW